MTIASIPCYQPVARKEYLDRLAALPPGVPGTSDLWTEVHDEIQTQLALLETEVRRRVPGVDVRGGRTNGDRFFLFSYRTFSMPGSAVDPVVVGMTFTPAPQGVAVEADVSGEQTGDLISSVPGETMSDSREEVLAAAGRAARKLCQNAELIAAALQNPSRTVE